MRKCSDCNFLRDKIKFSSKRYFCRYKGCIRNPTKKVCDNWEKQTKEYSSESTIKDYQ